METIVLAFRMLKGRIFEREFMAQSGASHMRTHVFGKAPQMDTGTALACRAEVEEQCR